MKIKKVLLLALAALNAPAWGQTCQPSAVSPYLNINGTTAWAGKSSASLNTGATVVLGPQPTSGTWSWSGCGTSGSSREQTVKLTASCTATATYTNSCGANTVQQYNFTVWPAMASNAGKYIMVDQFGYQTNAKKLAVLRTPHTGFDGSSSNLFWPQQLSVVNSATGTTVYSFWPTEWNNQATDASSGDQVWYFDFSSVTTPGTYEIVDTGGQRSARFEIGDNVYRNVLIQAVRMFYYQRIGQAKTASNAGSKWADGASNLGSGQDPQARRFLDKNNASTGRDLRGGWADAGDYNKYTSWAAGYTQELMDAYVQNPTVFTDDFNIPESYNGIPDILDEAKWGLDWLKRMQNSDGSVLSIVGVSGASPPSADSSPSYYGDASTSATLAAAAAFAEGAKVLGSLNNSSLTSYVSDLLTRAQNAYTWAANNPSVVFQNNASANGTSGLGVGQQETDDNGRITLRMVAAIKLFAATGTTAYRDYVDANYTTAQMFKNWSLSGFSAGDARPLMYYASLSGATTSVASAIHQRYSDLMNRSDYDNWGAIDAQRDPYRAQIGSYTWASNATKANAGTLFTEEGYYGISTHTSDQVKNAAVDYLHYLHGVNPLGKVYLTNMNSFGAENSTNQIWHTWFSDGSAWDDAKNSLYGPAPGYLVGGPAGSQYGWDSGCPSVSSACGSAQPAPPYGQPGQKSYLDFNTGWPLNSWSVAEPSNGYQVAYIRLLARFVQ
ncbi:glycoside hydrolase family 9 protein [Hydrocarboniphaga sp.]|uniref:glycoside hydrolase family 9 protein n=1 Tax=Hydrocarboniphaga sp. TaxID=2033016 RepID=UPI003D0AE995